MASYTNPSDVLSDIRRSTVFTPLANFAASISSITDATRAIKRIKTSEINDSILSFVKKSDELKRASRIIRSNPGVFESRSQAIAWSNKARSISMDAGGNRLSAFQRQFGHTAGTSLFNQENAQLFTNRMAEIGRSPRQQRIFDYYQQFGGAASSDSMSRAEQIVGEEDRKQTRIERQKGLRAYAYDQMGDYERTRYDLSQKYKSSSLADAKIRRDALKRLPGWMKDIVSNSRISTKTLFGLQKQMENFKKIPFVGKMFDPVSMGLGIGVGVVDLAFRGSHAVDKANANLASWGNAKDVYGEVSQRFMKSAMLAGIQDPRKIQDLYGKLTAEKGDADMFLSAIGPGIARMKPGREKTAVMKSLRFDPEMMKIASFYSGEKVPEFFRQELGNTVRSNIKKIQMTANPEGLMDFLKGVYGDASVAAKFIDEKDWAYWNDVVRKNDSVTKAIDSENTYQKTYSTGASNSPSGGKVINVSINTGDVVLPNAKDGQSFADDLFDFSEKKTGTLHAFDSGIK